MNPENVYPRTNDHENRLSEKCHQKSQYELHPAYYPVYHIV